MTNSNLLPYQFCGSVGYVKKNLFTRHHSVECNTCGAKMAVVLLTSTKAIEK